MNAKEAKKELSFPDLMARLGHSPIHGGIKHGGNEIWYRSPLSNESNASFHITKGRHIAWVFKCFSSGHGGSIIDFVIAHEGYAPNDISSALNFLSEIFPGSLLDHKTERGGGKGGRKRPFSFHQQSAPGRPNPAKTLQFIKDYPLKSGKILKYLHQKRKISPALAQKYLRLVLYKNMEKDKTFYAFGMKNMSSSGGFEIRSASDEYTFKSALIARDISVVQARPNSGTVHVFEGMLDFLSFLAMMDRDEPFCDTIVMHSVNSYKRTADFIRSRGYRRICTFLDNDPTGFKCTKRFEDEFGGSAVSCSHHFLPYKDVNKALQEGQGLQPFPNFPDGSMDCSPV